MTEFGIDFEGGNFINISVLDINITDIPCLVTHLFNNCLDLGLSHAVLTYDLPLRLATCLVFVHFCRSCYRGSIFVQYTLFT